MSTYKICSFFGHSEIEVTDELKDNLFQTLEKMIVEESFGIFYFGGFSEFDELCHNIISKLKQKYPHIKRIFCLHDPRLLRASKRPPWLCHENYEEFVYLDLAFDYWYKRIYFRNLEMINQSDFVIFYVTKTENSGAFKAMQYAKKQKKNFINFGSLK